MLGRVVILLCALIGGLTLAQFPAYSQLYVDLLRDRVALLTETAAEFDAAAAAAGVSREGALRQLSGTPALDLRQAEIRAAFADRGRLAAALSHLETASAVGRLGRSRDFSEEDLRAESYAALRPGLPRTPDALLLALIGFLLAYTIAGTFLAILRRLSVRAPK